MQAPAEEALVLTPVARTEQRTEKLHSLPFQPETLLEPIEPNQQRAQQSPEERLGRTASFRLFSPRFAELSAKRTLQ